MDIITTIGVCGLGRMGSAVAARLMRAGYRVCGYDPHLKLPQNFHANFEQVNEIEKISQQRLIWLMVPAGNPVDELLDQLMLLCESGTVIVDGGNSHFVDTRRREQRAREKGILFLDCGTSGGVLGESLGFSLMVGGDRAAYERIKPQLLAIGMEGGVGYIGPSGAGHYVKMIHNGIEYGLLQAYAEGFQIIKQGAYRNDGIDLAALADVWMHGSIIRSFILELSRDVLRKDQDFLDVDGVVENNGTGIWTVEEARTHTIPVPVIAQAVDVRAWSVKTGGNYATKMVALLRNAFGGHAVKKLKK